ncbi:YciI family protein [Cellulomonas sp. APG4]|uniref:YciI family protein n=1 Tax=Cellulomonas sp. APG4 TaxID=1538656 RepID=UPI00351B0AB9
MLLHQDERVWAEADADERARYIKEHDDFSAAAAATPGVEILGGEALTSVASATTLRRHGDQVTITEGPYAETVEQLGGFYLIEAPDLDVLTSLLPRLPEYTLEIRPVADVP